MALLRGLQRSAEEKESEGEEAQRQRLGHHHWVRGLPEALGPQTTQRGASGGLSRVPAGTGGNRRGFLGEAVMPLLPLPLRWRWIIRELQHCQSRTSMVWFSS